MLISAVGCVSAAGCSSSDPPHNDHPTDNAGAGGFAGASASASSAGASGMMMPFQMGNGPSGGQGGATGLAGGGGAMSIAGAGGSSSGASGAGGSPLSHGGAGGARTTGGASGAGAGMSGISGMSGVAGMSGMNVETGRLMGMTAAHNAVRAAVDTNTSLPPLVWSDKLAQYAQQWADELAASSCSSPHHRTSQELQAAGYGENLAAFTSSTGGSTAQQAVSAWASEKTCYTFGKLMTTDQCDTACYTALHSDGCGHYTQIVWRTSTSVGCGVATCQNGKEDIWICNYSPPGNYLGQNPY
ncbi:MAG TPA: CAP domain-containing protein [Polyangiaceae bacterium]|nr:CAP domain-containing protein [Polyangiaceae bacterium]